MPSAGSSHFYSEIYKRYERIQDGCVNALGGLFSFLRMSRVGVAASQFCVNALGGLFSFLHSHWTPEEIEAKPCVNALGGLFSFLPMQDETTESLEPVGVNALGGLFSFLPLPCSLLWAFGRCVSMPSAGSSHFYENQRKI